jgi:predicted membrane channel-forming protein YqfA (hemolysin III family)
MLFQGGFSFANFLADVITVFMFVLWFWLIITVFGDLIRRRDISGFRKALWVIALIVLPYIGVFAYLLFQGRGMAERHNEQIQRARDDIRRAVGFSVADEIEKLDRLKTSGAISGDEYAGLRAKLIPQSQ